MRSEPPLLTFPSRFFGLIAVSMLSVGRQGRQVLNHLAFLLTGQSQALEAVRVIYDVQQR